MIRSMDALNNDTENLFSLPVALIFHNGSDVFNDFVNNATAGFNENVTGHVWKKDGVISDGPHHLEKLADVMRRELKWAFILHTYGFGCLFFILAFYTFFSVLNLRSFISSRPFMSTINGFLCLLGTSRAGSLFIDPYNLKENMPKLIGQVLWDLGFPSIISAFCLVQLAFLQLTQLQIGPEGLRRKSCLSLIVTAHFILTIGMDIVVASHENLTIVKHVIQYIFLTWGVFLCCNFLYSGYKVMSMIRNIPGGLKHRDLPDPSYKGIMQLAILAPHNNLAGSVTAALLPTLCAPKIHQQDNTGLSAVGFRNDGNSRILESESIPMLEEMAGSSGDEKSPKLLTRGSSFQNQTRNTQKFNLKPKLSLKSVSDRDSKDEMESSQGKHLGPKSPKSSSTPKTQSPKVLSAKSSEFDFGVKTGSNGILKHTENFVTTKSIYEFKCKIPTRMSFENENFHFSNGKKSKIEQNSPKSGEETTGNDSLIPNILISCPSGCGSSENVEETKIPDKKDEANVSADEKNKENNLSEIMNEISNDLNEMQIVREEKSNRLEETVEVHVKNETKKDKFQLTPEGHSKSKNELERRLSGGESRRGSQTSDGNGSRRNSCRKDSNNLIPGSDGGRRGSDSSALTEITKYDETPVMSPKVRGRRKTKSLSWKKKDEDEEEESATQECLLPQENSTDVSLRSVLNHIAYMNRGQQGNGNSEDDLEKVRKSKVEWVLNITYITAMWGLMLCLSNMGRIYSPFGVPEPRRVYTAPVTNSTRYQEASPTEETGTGIIFSPWPWLWFQTFCRALELAMGCAMANITRQPTANYRYPRTLSIRHRDNFYSI